MNEEKAEAGEKAQSIVTLRKEIVPYEQEGPVEEPLFVNHCQVGYHSGTVYIDVGIIPLDEVAVPVQPTELRFIVLNRLVMSRDTLATLKLQVDELISKIGGIDAQGEFSSGTFLWGQSQTATKEP